MQILRSRWMSGVLLPLLVLSLLFSLGYAKYHEDEKTDSTAAQPPQTTPPAQNADAERSAVYAQINQEYQAVRPLLEYSCFDCHSTKTNYPWYHALPIIKGMIDDDIKHGMHHLDLSVDFPFIGKGSQVNMLQEMREEIESGNMPPTSYRLMHWGRKIEGEKQDSLFKWIDASIARLKTLKGQDDQDFE